MKKTGRWAAHVISWRKKELFVLLSHNLLSVVLCDPVEAWITLGLSGTKSEVNLRVEHPRTNSINFPRSGRQRKTAKSTELPNWSEAALRKLYKFVKQSICYKWYKIVVERKAAQKNGRRRDLTALMAATVGRQCELWLPAGETSFLPSMASQRTNIKYCSPLWQHESTISQCNLGAPNLCQSR